MYLKKNSEELRFRKLAGIRVTFSTQTPEF